MCVWSIYEQYVIDIKHIGRKKLFKVLLPEQLSYWAFYWIGISFFKLQRNKLQCHMRTFSSKWICIWESNEERSRESDKVQRTNKINTHKVSCNKHDSERNRNNFMALHLTLWLKVRYYHNQTCFVHLVRICHIWTNVSDSFEFCHFNRFQPILIEYPRMSELCLTF